MLLLLLHRKSPLPAHHVQVGMEAGHCHSCGHTAGGWGAASQPETPTLQWVPSKRAAPYPGTHQAPPAPHGVASTATLRPTHPSRAIPQTPEILSFKQQKRKNCRKIRHILGVKCERGHLLSLGSLARHTVPHMDSVSWRTAALSSSQGQRAGEAMHTHAHGSPHVYTCVCVYSTRVSTCVHVHTPRAGEGSRSLHRPCSSPGGQHKVHRWPTELGG